MITRKLQADEIFLSGLVLNSAVQWLPRTKVAHPWSRVIFKRICICWCTNIM